MLSAFRSSWALFLGIALIMVGNGLQASLLGVRATMESFDTTVTGVIMSAFYVGFLAGSALTPAVVRRVGHIRVFAAWASLASAAVLIHGVWVDPVVWIFMRAFTGFAYAGMYVVAESWLNDQSDNQTRGQILSFYMFVQYIGLAGGQLMLNAAAPEGLLLFLTASILVSIALIPISLTSSPAPLFAEGRRVKISDLWRLTPFGVVSCAVAGATTGILLGIGAVYAASAGYSVEETSFFMAALILGGVVLQIPVGRASDRVSRRGVIIAATFVASGLAAASFYYAPEGWQAIAAAFVLGGFSLPLYALAIAHANDDLEPAQMVAASSALIFVFGLGAALGPVGVSWVMSQTEPVAFFATVAVLHCFLGVYGLYRTTRRETVSERTTYRPMPFSVSSTPEVYYDSEEDH